MCQYCSSIPSKIPTLINFIPLIFKFLNLRIRLGTDHHLRPSNWFSVRFERLLLPNGWFTQTCIVESDGAYGVILISWKNLSNFTFYCCMDWIGSVWIVIISISLNNSDQIHCLRFYSPFWNIVVNFLLLSVAHKGQNYVHMTNQTSGQKNNPSKIKLFFKQSW